MKTLLLALCAALIACDVVPPTGTAPAEADAAVSPYEGLECSGSTFQPAGADYLEIQCRLPAHKKRPFMMLHGRGWKDSGL